MSSEEIFVNALKYEEKIRDLYLSAVEKVDDQRGKVIFQTLADDEQSHIDFLNYSLKQLKESDTIDVNKLQTPIPSSTQYAPALERMLTKIPDQMLGDVKSVLNSALQLEKETSNFYRNACSKTEGQIQAIFRKFLEIEERHVEVVQIELDHAMNNGIWFNFMEYDMED